ncbi:hypothetical protein BH23GEM9_BH23GEM9_29580 [soil metagenome]
MYSHCMFCQRSLGANEVLEVFPVGRRIAFDSATGRLWVVCRRCERWNLTPLEERWEAIEDAERLFRGTRLRVSTEHVGLARLREGLELVRIGRPLRPEFAAWRYGDQFGRRRRRVVAMGVGAAGVVGVVATAGVITGVLSMTLLLQSGNLVNLYHAWSARRTRAQVPVGPGQVLKLRRDDLLTTLIKPAGSGGLSVEIKTAKTGAMLWHFSGPEAEQVAALLLPKLNSTGAGRRTIQESVQKVDDAGGASEYMRDLMARPPLPSWSARKHRPEHGIALSQLPTPHRLALEMALHEQQERNALEGELKGLELAWHAAEEVAGIADDLLVTDDVRERLEKLPEQSSSQ